MQKEVLHGTDWPPLPISQQAGLETLQTFSEGYFSFLDLNIKMGICNPFLVSSLTDMAVVVQIVSKITPFPWELSKWNNPNSTRGALFCSHGPTPVHSNWAKHILGTLIQCAFIYICESGISEILALKITQIFIINSGPKMTYMYLCQVQSTKPNSTSLILEMYY